MSLYTANTPFTWGMAMTALRNSTARFLTGSNDILEDAEVVFDSCMEIDCLQELFYVRDWLFERPELVFRMYGLIILDDESESRCEDYQKFSGLRFVFDNEDDLTFFNMSCHNGSQIAA